MEPSTHVLVLGAGPAGLTAAYELARRGIPCTVLEAHPKQVGGLAKTIDHNGFRFDIGPHRFFSRSQQVEDLWSELLPDDWLKIDRLTRIFYHGKYLAYPLNALEALTKLGPTESIKCAASFFRSKCFPKREIRSFEDWVTDRFGKRLYELFFKSYTEKVWGIPPSEISSEWASQRIQNLSFSSAAREAIRNHFRRKLPDTGIKTLVSQFRYPKNGAGQVWENCAKLATQSGAKFLLGKKVRKNELSTDGKRWVTTFEDTITGEISAIEASHLFSSIPLDELALSLVPSLSSAAREAAKQLKYRTFISVNLILSKNAPFPDHWLYIHDPTVQVARITHYSRWSEGMRPEQGFSSLGLEYFSFAHNGLCGLSDDELIQLAVKECGALRLASATEITDGFVQREAKAYPLYDHTQKRAVTLLKEELHSRFPTLHLMGRAGLHRYNNQDHSMLTAQACVHNLLSGTWSKDPWLVNADASYIESTPEETSGSVSGIRLEPQRLRPLPG